jgi:hypothetical protein
MFYQVQTGIHVDSLPSIAERTICLAHGTNQDLVLADLPTAIASPWDDYHGRTIRAREGAESMIGREQDEWILAFHESNNSLPTIPDAMILLIPSPCQGT